jgi:hypothetical protein
MGMSSQQRELSNEAATATTTTATLPAAAQLTLQRKCACGGAAGLGGSCASCRGNELAMPQRSALPIGRPLTAGTKVVQQATKATGTASAAQRVRAGTAIQLQADTTPPPGRQDEEQTPDAEGRPEAAAAGEEIPDDGEGVASIERGSPSAAPAADEEKRPVQAKPASPSAAPQGAAATGQVFDALQGGAALEHHARSGMEQFFTQDLSGVSIHTDSRAQRLASSLGAQAFTVGHKIAFAPGKYQPQTAEGRKLLAHELTHVIQQRRGISGEILQSGMGRVGDQYEVEADHVAERINQTWPTQAPTAAPRPIHAMPLPAPPVINRSAIQLFSGSAAAAYAKKWATSTNSAYGRFDNDCTNFASQAMEAGGWGMIFGSNICDKRKDDDVWWYLKDGCSRWYWSNVDASYTWGGAENFYQFMKTSGRGTAASRVMDLGEGDVLQMDFNGTGHRGHTMVVTKKTTTNLFLSYHTSDHLDEPFYADGANPGILARYPDPPTKYYAWKIV